MSEAFLATLNGSSATNSNVIQIQASSISFTILSNYSSFASFTGNFVSVFCFISHHSTGNYYFSACGALNADMDEFSITMMIENGDWRILFLRRVGYDI